MLLKLFTVSSLLLVLVPATALAAEGGGEEEGGNFLVTPTWGLMLWTLIAFGITLWVLSKLAFPRIGAALDRRQRAIEESIDTAERTRKEAEELLAEYRERLRDARSQADDIVARARKAAEVQEREALESGRRRREELVEQARRDIEAETRRAVQEIRDTVADLTVLATEKVTRKSLTREDQERLVAEALGEIDFSQLTAENGGR